MNDVKDYRKDELKYYVIGNILLFIIVVGYSNGVFDGIFNSNKCFQVNEALKVFSWLLGTGFATSVGYVFVYLLDTAVPEPWKKKLCNWLTGRSKLYYGKIFLAVKKGKFKDKRFTSDQAKIRYKNKYTKLATLSNDNEMKKVSNSFWYHIFYKRINEPTVFVTYRDYLLCRDLVVITALFPLLFLFCFFLCCWFAIIDCCKFLNTSSIKLILLWWGFELFLSRSALRAKQKRLSYNVIAVDIHK